VDPDLCIGCGVCANACVFKDRPAIRVTSANESRHRGNQPVLPGLGGSITSGTESQGISPSASGGNDPYGG